MINLTIAYEDKRLQKHKKKILLTPNIVYPIPIDIDEIKNKNL